MLKERFNNQAELNTYIKEQTERKIKGYLTASERDQLERLIKNPKEYIKEIKETPKGKPIVTNIEELKRPCQEVNKNDNLIQLIQDLKDTLETKHGLGISANQIGINKRISYVKIPKFQDKNGKWNYNEYILINAKIIEKDKPIKVQGEMCLSFPGISIITKRYVFCTIEYYNEKFELQTAIAQDLEALTIQHECDHQNGITIFDRKWRAK